MSLSYLRLDHIARPLIHWTVPRDGTPPATETKGALTDEQIRGLIKREGKGDSFKAVRALATDAANARERARAAEAKLKDAETNGIAPKDGVIVKGDDAKAFADVQKYMADNKLSLKDVLENAKATPELKMKVEKIESLKIVGEAAEDEGWDSEVLAEVLESKGFEIARRDVRRVDEDTGKKVVESVWHTRKAGDDKGEWTPLAEHAEEHWKLFIPALVAGVGTDDDEAEANAAQDGATRAKRQGAQRDEGTRFVEQSRSRTPPEGKAKDTKALREEAINSGIYNTL